MNELFKHYNNSKKKYDIIGESHLEYYREKYPKKYKKLKEYYDTNNK